MIEKVNAIVNNLSKLGKMRFLEGTTKEEIAQFEAENNYQFPTQYKEWLEYSDGGEFFLPAGIQLYGVSHKPLINVEKDDRPSKDYCIIGALATGDPILCKRDSQEVAIYNHEAGRIEDDEIYPDFFSFIEDLPNILGIGGEYDVQSDESAE